VVSKILASGLRELHRAVNSLAQAPVSALEPDDPQRVYDAPSANTQAIFGIGEASYSSFGIGSVCGSATRIPVGGPSDMTMTFKLAMGALSVILMLIAYAIYIGQTARAEGVRPHPFSWFLWGFVTGVAYLVQITQGAGAGSWVVGFTAIICLFIGAISLFKYRWRFSSFDWFCLVAGLVVFLYYMFSKNPTQSAILATTTDIIGYGSTLKNGWTKPHKDSATSFALNSAKFVPSLFALESYSIATWLYPATLVLMNGAVAAMLIVRRRQLDTSRRL
jgi:hypothetical protein